MTIDSSHSENQTLWGYFSANRWIDQSYYFKHISNIILIVFSGFPELWKKQIILFIYFLCTIAKVNNAVISMHTYWPSSVRYGVTVYIKNSWVFLQLGDQCFLYLKCYQNNSSRKLFRLT
jgi:hypothetical protein